LYKTRFAVFLMLFSAFTVFANFTLELFFLIKVHQAFLLCKDQVLRSVLIENHSVIPFEIFGRCLFLKQNCVPVKFIVCNWGWRSYNLGPTWGQPTISQLWLIEGAVPFSIPHPLRQTWLRCMLWSEPFKYFEVFLRVMVNCAYMTTIR